MTLESVEPIAIIVIFVILFAHGFIRVYKWLFFPSHVDTFLDDIYYDDKYQTMMSLYNELAERMVKVESTLQALKSQSKDPSR